MSLKVFNFVCAHGHTFEAMVQSIAEFERQKAAGLFRCPFCDSADVERALSAPHVRVGSAKDKQIESQREFHDAYQELKKIIDQSEYVGDRFAEEARAIKNGIAEERVITGTATTEEVEELQEEGIDVFPIGAVPPASKVN